MSLRADINHCTRMVQDGVEYSQVKSYLREKGYEGSDLRFILSSVDDAILQQSRSSRNWFSGTLFLTVAYSLLGGGMLLLVLTYYGVLDLQGFFLVPYGPILGGIGMIMKYNSARRKR